MNSYIVQFVGTLKLQIDEDMKIKEHLSDVVTKTNLERELVLAQEDYDVQNDIDNLRDQLRKHKENIKYFHNRKIQDQLDTHDRYCRAKNTLAKRQSEKCVEELRKVIKPYDSYIGQELTHMLRIIEFNDAKINSR